jgi:hypothetical protein
MPAALVTKYVFSLRIIVAAPIEAGDIGHGSRRVIPITGGELIGEGMHGRIREGGADYQVIRPDGFTELEAKYAIEMDDGASSISRTSASASVRRRRWSGSGAASRSIRR